MRGSRRPRRTATFLPQRPCRSGSPLAANKQSCWGEACRCPCKLLPVQEQCSVSYTRLPGMCRMLRRLGRAVEAFDAALVPQLSSPASLLIGGPPAGC